MATTVEVLQYLFIVNRAARRCTDSSYCMSAAVYCPVIDVNVSFDESQLAIGFGCECVYMFGPAHVFTDVDTQILVGVSRNTAPRHRAHRAHRAEIHAWVLTE